MKYIQLILDNSTLRFEQATSIYKIRNLVIVEYMNEENIEVAQAVEIDKISKIFVGGKRYFKEKIVDRENPEIFPEE